MTTVNKTGAKVNLGDPKPELKPVVETSTAAQTESEEDNSNVGTASAADYATKPATVIEDQSSAALDSYAEDAHDTSSGRTPTSSDKGMAQTSSSGQSMGLLNQAQERDGFNDLDDELGFGSFDIIKLDKDVFVCGEEDIGSTFDCIMVQSKKKFIIKEPVKKTDKVVYTYDKIHTANGDRLLSAVFAEWEQDDCDTTKLEERRYQEVVVLVTSGPASGKLALLSVPPSSVRRFAGYRATLKILRKGLKLVDAVTRCSKGKKITTKDKETYYPWKFDFVRRAKPEDMNLADLSEVDVGADENPE